MPIFNPLHRWRSVLHRGAGGGILQPPPLFTHTVYGEPINPAWEAIKATSKEPVPEAPVQDGYVSIGCKYDNALLNILGSEKLLTYYALEEHSDLDRTYSVGPWLKSWPGGPYSHVVGPNREMAVPLVEEASIPVRYGSPQYQAADGSTSQVYNLDSLDFHIGSDSGESLHIIACMALNNTGNEETLFALFGQGVTDDFIMFRKSATNVLSSQIFVNGAVNAASSTSAGADSLVAGDFLQPLWISVEIANGATLTTIKMRTKLGGTDTAVTVTPNKANYANFAQLIDRLIMFARPDDSLKVRSGGRNNGLFVFRNLPSGLISDTDWGTINSGTVDPYTFFPRYTRRAAITGRDPMGHRNRTDGELYIASTGTPTLSSASTPFDMPVDALYTGPCVTLNVTTSSVQHNVGCPGDGFWELMTESGKAATTFGLRWGSNPTATLSSPSQTLTGPRNSFCGGGPSLKLAIIGSQAAEVKIHMLYGLEGP